MWSAGCERWDGGCKPWGARSGCRIQNEGCIWCRTKVGGHSTKAGGCRVYDVVWGWPEPLSHFPGTGVCGVVTGISLLGGQHRISCDNDDVSARLRHEMGKGDHTSWPPSSTLGRNTARAPVGLSPALWPWGASRGVIGSTAEARMEKEQIQEWGTAQKPCGSHARPIGCQEPPRGRPRHAGGEDGGPPAFPLT